MLIKQSRKEFRFDCVRLQSTFSNKHRIARSGGAVLLNAWGLIPTQVYKLHLKFADIDGKIACKFLLVLKVPMHFTMRKVAAAKDNVTLWKSTRSSSDH